MSQLANIKYFAQKCNSVLGTNYSGGSWESTQAINMRWLCQAVQKVYKDIHTNQSSSYHTKFLSSRFSNSAFLNSQESLIACDKTIVDNVISYLLEFKDVCVCTMPSIPVVCGECAANVCGVCRSTCSTTCYTCDSSSTCEGKCDCNCIGNCECNCNCQCECTSSNCVNQQTTFCQCNCTQANNCMAECECNCKATCECQCFCNCTCQCACVCPGGS